MIEKLKLILNQQDLHIVRSAQCLNTYKKHIGGII